MSETVTMYQIYDPSDRTYLAGIGNFTWNSNKKSAHNFDTLRDVYEQMLKIPYHGVDAESDPANYCKIVKIQVTDPIRSLNLAKNDLRAVNGYNKEMVDAIDKTVKGIFDRHSNYLLWSDDSIKLKRDFFADLLRSNIPDITEEEVNCHVHKYTQERKK